VWLTIGGAVVVLALLAVAWRPLVAMTVDEDVARTEGVPTGALSIFFMLLVAAVVALALKVVGVLLVTALMVIPAVTARQLARSPEIMAFVAPAIGLLAVVVGLTLSLLVDSPAGPSIVVAEFSLFLLASALRSLRGAA
jgi:zinc transport system permease protein